MLLYRCKEEIRKKEQVLRRIKKGGTVQRSKYSDPKKSEEWRIFESEVRSKGKVWWTRDFGVRNWSWRISGGTVQKLSSLDPKVRRNKFCLFKWKFSRCAECLNTGIGMNERVLKDSKIYREVRSHEQWGIVLIPRSVKKEKRIGVIFLKKTKMPKITNSSCFFDAVRCKKGLLLLLLKEKDRMREF